MASGTIVGEGASEVPGEKKRFKVTKVYTRKAYKGLKKNVNSVATSVPVTATVTVAENDTVPVSDNNVVDGESLNTGSADAPVVVSTIRSDTDVGTAAGDAPVKATVAGDAKEKDSDNTNGDNTVQMPESQNHHPVDAVPESEACPLEETVPEPEVHPLEETAPEPHDHVLEDAVPEAEIHSSQETVPEPAAYPLENIVPESQARPMEQTVPETKALPVEDMTSVQQQPASCMDVPSYDYTSHNRQAAQGIEEVAAGNWVLNPGVDTQVRINLAAKSKQEKRELRRKLESELDVVRGLVKRIEAKEGQLNFGGFGSLQVSVNDGIDSGMRRASSDIGSVVVPRNTTTPIPTPTPRQSRPLSQLSVSVMENGQGVGESLEKEKRTPKANQFYRNSEFLLAKDKFPPAESNKKSKLNGKKHGGELGLGFGPSTKVFKNCSALLEKLMKHKHGWVFNTPVDVEGLRLHDYYTIIKHPMDLGTIKLRLNKNWYKAPEEFAEDVRLTFHNALTYNPKGQDVHVMAEQLLKIFEEKWAVIKSEYNREMSFTTTYHMGVPTPTPRKAPLLPVVPLGMRRILDRSMSYPSFDARPKPISTTPSARTPAPKKPKAKDPHKRDMTYEEKQKLSTNLQSLPLEKLDNIVQIIKKRDSALSQHDDEIEVDIDSVDTETLWELDRFVTNYKKNLSKNKRKAELAMQARAAAEQNVQQKPLAPAPIVVEAPKETQTITEERNVSTSSPVQAEKQGDNGSRSSSSSSSSSDSGSSSSDSDSDSSSASGSDVGH